jgi:hypothetical protein
MAGGETGVMASFAPAPVAAPAPPPPAPALTAAAAGQAPTRHTVLDTMGKRVIIEEGMATAGEYAGSRAAALIGGKTLGKVAGPTVINTAGKVLTAADKLVGQETITRAETALKPVRVVVEKVTAPIEKLERVADKAVRIPPAPRTTPPLTVGKFAGQPLAKASTATVAAGAS